MSQIISPVPTHHSMHGMIGIGFERGFEQHGPEEALPFTVRIVATEEELEKAVQIRQAAYGRHVPELAAKMGAPEELDFDPGTVVIVAESKLDGAPVGTMRIQTNAYRPLALEQSVVLPAPLNACRLAEATRLGISNDRLGRVVKAFLFKAFYAHCVNEGVDWMVIAGRSPLDQQYEALLFGDVFPGAGFIPMQHAANIPHRVMSLKVSEVEAKWRAANHRLYKLFFETTHPDLQLARGEFPAARNRPAARSAAARPN